MVVLTNLLITTSLETEKQNKNKVEKKHHETSLTSFKIRHIDSYNNTKPTTNVDFIHCHTFSGQGGIGKSSSLGILALDWAENARPELQEFQFVFLILLRYVEGNEPLETIILKQHGRLEVEKVSPSEVKALLEGETKANILLMFDGYDEYTKDSNDDIEKLLRHGKDNCFVILSSRSGDFLESIKTKMEEEVKITGFSYENIIKCTRKYLGSDTSCQEFLSQAEQASVHTRLKPAVYDGKYKMYEYKGLLHVPIILLMACTVFLENHCLPSSKTSIFKRVVNMCISRTTLKTMGKTAKHVENLHELLMKLGKVAWTALNRESKQLLIYKVRKFTGMVRGHGLSCNQHLEKAIGPLNFEIKQL